MKVLAIDPGLDGAMVATDGVHLVTALMPITRHGKDREVDFAGVQDFLERLIETYGHMPAYLERAVSFGMSTKSAFNYGRGFEAVVRALALAEYSVTYVEPGKWTKEMHQGISSDLKPKVKSQIAVERLYPKLLRALPRKPKGALHDGAVDALLIAGYALRKLGQESFDDVPDFY